MRAKPYSAFVKAEGEITEAGVKFIGYEIYCPGCKYRHVVYTLKGYYPACWSFNGDLERPTFTPSLLLTTGSFAQPSFEDGDIPPTRCHSFITDGRIKFLDDCTHELRNQIVDLPEIE